jgi:hypothetical protein
MVTAGYKEIHNIDISSVVIKQMQEMYKETPELSCMLLTNHLPFHS